MATRKVALGWPRDLRCPAGCPGYLLRDFHGEKVQTRCHNCGFFVSYSLHDPILCRALDNELSVVLVST